jgi:hypothetical protein
MGGGMAMNKKLLEKVIDCSRKDRKLCNCYRDDSPDDMQMGMWVSAYLGVQISNEMGFHQASPFQYDPRVLKTQNIISFHKWTDRADAHKTFDDYLVSRPNNHEL